MRLLIPLVGAILLLACNSSDSKPAGVHSWGGGGYGGTAGASGSGGTAGSAGANTGGSTGDGGSATGGGGGTGGSEADGSAGTGGEDAGVDAPLDVGLDVIEVVDTCPIPERAVSSKGLLAGGSTPPDFVDAYNAEVAALAQPGPMLLRFRGIDAATPSGWQLDLGGLQLVGGGPAVAFAGTPATIPFRLGELHSIYAEPADASFSLHFPTVDIPVVHAEIAGQLNDQCENLLTEGVRLLIPSTAADLPFHGSTVGALMGPPTQDHGGGKENAWPLEMAGTAEMAQMQ